MLHVPNNSYFESLRDLLSHLEKIGKLRRITKQVDKDWEIACVTRQVMHQRPENRYALLSKIFQGSRHRSRPTHWAHLATYTPPRSAFRPSKVVSIRKPSAPNGPAH